MDEKRFYFILRIEGGLGKHIAASAVIEAIKKHYPNCMIIVVCAYPDVFLNDPNVYRRFYLNETSYFFANYIMNQPDTQVHAYEPYYQNDFVHKRVHLIEAWCRLVGVPYNGEQPKLYLSNAELKEYGKAFMWDKPIFLIQISGGPLSVSGYAWPRDTPIEIAQAVVNRLMKDFYVVQIKGKDQLGLNCHRSATADPSKPQEIRRILVLIAMSTRRWFIDSFPQHAAAALGMPSLVTWIVNSPEQFGYKMHTNIIHKPYTRMPDLKHSFLNEFEISAPLNDYPFNDFGEIFDEDEIYETAISMEVPKPFTLIKPNDNDISKFGKGGKGGKR